jgi:hypothetical protein
MSNLKLPRNMCGAMLPQLKPFEKFSTLGPEGPAVADISHGAAAIECYLDLNLVNVAPGLGSPLQNRTERI